MSDVLKRMLALLKFIVGVPEIDDGPRLRAFIQRILKWMEPLSDLTETEWDDKLVDVAQELINNDASWELIYDFLRARFGPSPPMLTSVEPLAGKLAGEFKLDLNTVLAILNLIVEVLKSIWGDND